MVLRGVTSPQTPRAQSQTAAEPLPRAGSGQRAGREQAGAAAYLLFPPAEQRSRLSQQRCLEGCPHTSCPHGCAPQSGATPSLLQRSREREKTIPISLCFPAIKSVGSQPGRKPRAATAPALSCLSAGPVSRITEGTDRSNGRSASGAAGQLPRHEAASAPQLPQPAQAGQRAQTPGAPAHPSTTCRRQQSRQRHRWCCRFWARTKALGRERKPHRRVSRAISAQKGTPEHQCWTRSGGGEAPSPGRSLCEAPSPGGTRRRAFNPQQKHALKTRPAATPLYPQLNSFLLKLVVFLAKEPRAPAQDGDAAGSLLQAVQPPR